MRDRLIELIKGARKKSAEIFEEETKKWLQIGEIPKHKQTIDEIEADYLLENSVIVPLLQTGQTVYRVSKNRMWEVKIWKVEICGGTVSYIDNYDKSFFERHIGKGVYLTREEAIQALKGGAEYCGDFLKQTGGNKDINDN